VQRPSIPAPSQLLRISPQPDSQQAISPCIYCGCHIAARSARYRVLGKCRLGQVGSVRTLTLTAEVRSRDTEPGAQLRRRVGRAAGVEAGSVWSGWNADASQLPHATHVPGIRRRVLRGTGFVSTQRHNASWWSLHDTLARPRAGPWAWVWESLSCSREVDSCSMRSRSPNPISGTSRMGLSVQMRRCRVPLDEFSDRIMGHRSLSNELSRGGARSVGVNLCLGITLRNVWWGR
jgi:hypothetical protein